MNLVAQPVGNMHTRASLVTIKLFGIPDAFATSLGLATA
jgi:hypothetical protein